MPPQLAKVWRIHSVRSAQLLLHLATCALERIFFLCLGPRLTSKKSRNIIRKNIKNVKRYRDGMPKVCKQGTRDDTKVKLGQT